VAVTSNLRIACLWLLCALPFASAAQSFDPEHSRFGFELRTRWGQRIVGTFPRYEGEVAQLPDGRRQVRIRLATDAVEIAGPRRYALLARGERFFDAARYPWIEFLSEPYPAQLSQAGGRLRGTLTMHGISRSEVFQLAPSACARPALDCDVVAHGSVRRDDYELDSWRFAMADRVEFTLRVRLLRPVPMKAAP